MDAFTDTILDDETPRARLGLLLQHFSQLDDTREPWRVLYPLHEVLLLVTCATIASCDDFDDIVAWGRNHLAFLRRFSEFHHGIPKLAQSKQLEGALVTIDAMGCQVEIADKIVAHKADYLLALKGNQPTLEADVEDYFRTAPAGEVFC